MAVLKKSEKKRIAARAILPEEILRELPGARPASYDAGTFIYREGAKATNFCLILSGRVRILKRNVKGDDVPLALVKAGEFLGEMAMLSGDKRSASALALTRVKTLVVNHDDLLALLKVQNPFATRLALQLCILLASRCHQLLRLIARHPDVIPHDVKKVTPLDVRAVLQHVHTLWAV
ncbi:MAG: cyclic nucleotide-binding domain-containing protein [Verrucomicrobiota bacterium]